MTLNLEDRNEFDYETFINYKEQEVMELFDKMKEFINNVNEILLQDRPINT